MEDKIKFLRSKKASRIVIPRLTTYMMQNFELYPKIGIEWEFYINPIPGFDIDHLEVKKKIEKENALILSEERGKGQYEAALPFERNIQSLIEKCDHFKYSTKRILYEYDCKNGFCPLPHKNDHGSALHINITLHRGFESLYREESSVRENRYIIYSVAGILHLLQEGMYITASDFYSFQRLRYSKDDMSPKNVSWGINNRTTAIRIASSVPLRSRRLEFRVPSSSDRIESAIIFCVVGSVLWIGI